jgi:hypothetical protein
LKEEILLPSREELLLKTRKRNKLLPPNKEVLLLDKKQMELLPLAPPRRVKLLLVRMAPPPLV